MNNDVRVLVVDSLTGNDYSLCLCRGLEAAGAQVELVTVEGRKAPFPITFAMHRWAPSKDQEVSKAGKLINYLKYLSTLFFYTARASRKQPCVVHFQFFRRPRIESVYLLLLRLTRAKLIYTAHNILPHESRKIDWWLKGLVYRSVHDIIVHSSFIKRALLDAFPMRASKVHVIPHGNFDHYLSAEDPSKEEARKRLGLDKDAKVLLFFGYIREYKGLDELLEAFPSAASNDEKLRLVIAGSPHTDTLKKTYTSSIERSGVADRILFHAKFIDSKDVSTYFAASDLVMLPYKNIYHSGIIHLAYSYGRPVLATNVGDFSETIEAGRTGYVLKENTAKQLAQEIVASCSNMEDLEKMGDYARKLSRTKYSWQDIGKATLQVYR